MSPKASHPIEISPTSRPALGEPSISDVDVHSLASLEDLPLVLTLKQTTDLLAVDRRTIYSQIRSGKLRAFKVGNAYRIERDSLLAFIRADRSHRKRR